MKQQLALSATLAYFKPDAPMELIVDTNHVGRCAALLQVQNGERRPIAYASRTLMPVERRYSQTEREAFRLVWACERLHHVRLARPRYSIERGRATGSKQSSGRHST